MNLKIPFLLASNDERDIGGLVTRIFDLRDNPQNNVFLSHGPIITESSSLRVTGGGNSELTTIYYQPFLEVCPRVASLPHHLHFCDLHTNCPGNRKQNDSRFVVVGLFENLSLFFCQITIVGVLDYFSYFNRCVYLMFVWLMCAINFLSEKCFRLTF